MANEQNLAPPFGTEGAYKPTSEDRAKGGKASGPARKWNNEMRKRVQAFLMKQTGETEDGEPLTTMDDLLAFAFEHFKESGNAELLKFFRDTAGEKPTDKVEVREDTVTVTFTDVDEEDEAESGD